MKSVIFSTLLFFFSILQINAQDDFLANLLMDNSEHFETILANPEKFEVQIVYTQIDRDKDNVPSFKTHTYRLDENQYFYPASTVKMPTAFMALEKLNGIIENEIQDSHVKSELDKFSWMTTKAVRYPQTITDRDSTSKDGVPSIGHYIKKIFLVSDNDAQNRLYEFCGQAYLNNKLREMGFDKTRIIHRLGPGGFPFNYYDNQYTNPILFKARPSWHEVRIPFEYFRNEVHSKVNYDLNLNNEIKGVAHQKGDKIIDKPFDFSKKNFISILDLHDMLKAVIFPESLPEEKRFNLTESDYEWLYRAMSQFPNEGLTLKYDKPDNYCKFFIYGDKPEDFEIPKHIRIFNKVGWAYGYLTDVAYIVDFEKNIEFFVTATIHVNENQTYNDGVYEYEEIGLPFFANLGRVLYDFEDKRERKFKPDLSKFKVEYW